MPVICEYCREELGNCICPNVARFFEENGHLMADTEGGKRREEVAAKKFFYVKNDRSCVSH